MKTSYVVLLACLAGCGGVKTVTPRLPVFYAGLDANLLTSQRCWPLTLVDETKPLQQGAEPEPISPEANVIVVYSQEVTLTCQQYGGESCMISLWLSARRPFLLFAAGQV